MRLDSGERMDYEPDEVIYDDEQWELEQIALKQQWEEEQEAKEGGDDVPQEL